jgi:DNA ligase-1
MSELILSFLHRSFFKAPNGDTPKAAPKQSKLSFSSKSNGAPSSSAAVANDDVEMKDESSDAGVKPKVKKEESSDSKENVKPGSGMNFEPVSTGFMLTEACTETKKRSRSPPPKTEAKEEKKSVKKEVIKQEEEDEDDEPVVKRPRRSAKTEEDEDDEPIVAKATSKPQAASKKSKNMAPPPKKIKKEVKEEDEDDVEEPSSSKEALKRRGSSASASASDEEGLEDDDEDEKPEIAAKAREKVQTTLKSKAKDPYPDWKPGEPVPYAALCTTFSLIEMTSKRLIIQSHCSLFLRQVLRLTPDDLLPTVMLMINKLAADYAGIELGIGESLIKKAIGESTGRSLAVITQDQKEIGDLGLVAVKSRANQPTMFKPKPLTIRGVLRGLIEVATTSGHGAQGAKVDKIKKLLSAADGHTSGKVDITKDKGGASEAKFIIRFLEGKLRLGLAERTVIVSLAQAMVCHEVEANGSGKVPSTEQLAKGESILKAVYRYVSILLDDQSTNSF